LQGTFPAQHNAARREANPGYPKVIKAMRNRLMLKTPQSKVEAVSGRRVQRASATGMLVALAVAMPFAADALPVIPGGKGFGMETPAGRGGKVYRVTNLNASGAGSLKECVSASGPRVCVFEVSGTIRLTSDMKVLNPNLTIAGQTAPSPGITIRGAALNIQASDVLVQHIRVRVGDDPDGPAIGNRDALKIEGTKPVKNVVIDHVSLAWAADETLTAWEVWDNITISNSIIGEALYLKSNGKTSGYGIYLGQSGTGRATVIGNLMAHTAGRNPLVRSYDAVIVNNVVYNAYSSSIELQSLGVPMKVSVVGNTIIPGADTGSWNKPISINTDGWPMVASSKVYLSDNMSPDVKSTDVWALANSGFSSSMKTTSAPIWVTGLTTLPTSGNTALNHVLNNAGARPADRDSVDQRIVQSVRDRSGRIINCVSADGSERCKKNAGGWPKLAENRRALTLPSDHNEVTASGYTKLELWLHEMAAQVEGRSAANPRPPVLTVE
jgi:hypothetical protein